MQEILLLLAQDIHKSYVVHVIPHSLHHTSDTGCCQLEMVILLKCFIIEIYKLIRKPGTGIHRNSDPLRHPPGCHVLKYIYFIRNPACIMINLLSLNSQTDSSGKPLKKLHSQSILQRFYHLAHTRLCRIQNFRSITERSCLRTCHKILQLFQIHKISLCYLKKPVSAIILFQIVFLFYNSYISKVNVPTTIRSSPVPDFNDSFSWNTIYENAMVTRILSLSIGTITLAGPV